MNPLIIFLIVFGGLVGLIALVIGVVFFFFLSRLGPPTGAIVFLAGTGMVLGTAGGVLADYPVKGFFAGLALGVVIGLLRVAFTEPSFPFSLSETSGVFGQRLRDVLGRNRFGLAVFNFTVSAGSVVVIVAMLTLFGIIRAGTRPLSSPPKSIVDKDSFLVSASLWKGTAGAALAFGVLGIFAQWGMTIEKWREGKKTPLGGGHPSSSDQGTSVDEESPPANLTPNSGQLSSTEANSIIITCKGCGKRYRVRPKVSEVPVTFQCPGCNRRQAIVIKENGEILFLSPLS